MCIPYRSYLLWSPVTEFEWVVPKTGLHAAIKERVKNPCLQALVRYVLGSGVSRNEPIVPGTISYPDESRRSAGIPSDPRASRPFHRREEGLTAVCFFRYRTRLARGFVRPAGLSAASAPQNSVTRRRPAGLFQNTKTSFLFVCSPASLFQFVSGDSSSYV